MPQAYRATCLKLFGAVWEAGPGVLQLDDEGPDYVETRRLYELHFGEVYDPPVTRPVPLSMPHPLLDSPLAPFLDFYDAGAAAPLGVRPDGATAACGQRCGAHVLYLAYLLGRGTSRSKRSLLGWVMGAGYRRRTSVRCVCGARFACPCVCGRVRVQGGGVCACVPRDGGASAMPQHSRCCTYGQGLRWMHTGRRIITRSRTMPPSAVVR